MINKTLFYIVLIAVMFILVAWLFSDIFVYVSISLVLATILRPLTNFISRTYIFKVKVPRLVAILFSFGLVAGVISLFILLFIPLIIKQTEVISNLNKEVIYENLSGPLVAVENFLVEHKIIDPDKESYNEGIKESVIEFVGNISFKEILDNLLSFTGTFFVSILAIVFITFFLLYENALLSRQMIALVPNAYFEVFISALFKIEKLLSNYLIGLTLQMMAIFSVAALGLTIFGVNYAITIAIFAAVANLIPYLGPLLGAIFGIIVGLSTSAHFAFDNTTVILIAKIVSVFAVVQAMDNVLFQPLIFSKSVKAHPLEIFVVIFAAATLGGIPGMIAAIPFYTIIRVSVMEINWGFKRYQIFQVKKN
ncbi:MAG: AI-2E family transporter [Cyclobacteriaceae bacterium]